MQWLIDPDQRDGWQYVVGSWADRFIPTDPDLRVQLKKHIFRLIALTDVVLGVYYFYFRYTRSINMSALWFSLPLLIAETYSFIDTILFMMMMWRPLRRGTLPPLKNVTVDVLITTYQEPIELVRTTAQAALHIRYPHKTYVLDDGNRPEMKAVCDEIGCGYIFRGPEWENRPSHAKAGNINNALMKTAGEFILILDADQVPVPSILHRVLGYFVDQRLAFVQTPQYFYNVPDGDPFGSQAPLFYGPIQQGKDGWNAAFFCGSNAVLRRESLMQLGVMTYVRNMEKRITDNLNHLPIEVAERRGTLPRKYRKSAEQISEAAQQAIRSLSAQKKTLDEVVNDFNSTVESIQREIVQDDLEKIAQDLADIEAMEVERAENQAEKMFGLSRQSIESVLGNFEAAIELLQDNPELQKEHPSLKALSIHTVADTRNAIEQGLSALANDLVDVAPPPSSTIGLDENILSAMRMETQEAIDIQPMATFSITEDMATAMRLHALGWKSIFHPEILAYGLAPEDLKSALNQRLRWAAGTIQVLLYDNPLVKSGLSWSQRLQYFTTIFSYFSGFASVVYLLAPVIYLFTGIPPVTSFAGEFLVRIIPYLLINQLMFQFTSWGMDTLRGEQYNLALFPLWIQAVVSVFGGEKLKFNVTPKTHQSGIFLHLVIPQLSFAVLLVMASLYGLFSLGVGWRNDVVGVIANIIWAGYDVLMLSVIIKAAIHRSFDLGIPKPPASVFPEKLLKVNHEAISLADWRSHKID